MTSEKFDLLVVEDDQRHVADARAYFAPIEQKGIVTVAYAGTLAEAEAAMAGTRYGGIISDIFFPIGKGPEEDKRAVKELYNLMDEQCDYGYDHDRLAAMDEWRLEKELPPAGVFVAQRALDEKIPVVFNTDTFHHGAATEPVNRWARKYEIPLVDPVVHVDDARSAPFPHKFWLEAYTELVARLEALENPWELRGRLYDLQKGRKPQDMHGRVAKYKPLFEKYGIEPKPKE